MGKGHGMKALLADYHKGCLMHDASYWCPVQLSGSPGSIVQVLQAVRQVPSSCHCRSNARWKGMLLTPLAML